MENQKHVKDKTDIRGFVIGAEIIHLNKLFRLNYLQDYNNRSSPLYLSAIKNAIIQTKYIMDEAKELEGFELTFTDDIDPEPFKKIQPRDKYTENISGLLKLYRDVVCHPYAGEKAITVDNQQYLSLSLQTGKEPPYETMPIKHLCKYDDDVAVLVGDNVMYIKRHLIRAYDEVSQHLLSLSRFRPYKELIEFTANNGDKV